MTKTRRVFNRMAIGCTAASALALAAGTATAEPLNVAAIYTVPVEQQWVSRIHKALNAAVERGDITYTFSENVANTDYERVMREYAEQGVDLVFGEVFGVESAAREVATDYPEVAWVMGSSFGPEEPNFSVFDNYIQECSYLTGLVAGSKTESKLIGLVGGYPIPEVNRLMHAFMEGAREIDPEIQFVVTFIGSWYDPPKAKEAAFAMIDAGADVMYAERYGVSDAAQERDVYAIGNVIDTQDEYPGTILASAIWHMEPTVDRAIEKVKDGDYTAENYGPLSHMPVGGCSIAEMDDDLVSAEVQDLVRAREAEIMAGSFEVEINDDEPVSTR